MSRKTIRRLPTGFWTGWTRRQYLAEHPEMGAARDDIRLGMRHWISGSCLLLCRITDPGVEIVRAVHGHRDLFSLSG